MRLTILSATFLALAHHMRAAPIQGDGASALYVTLGQLSDTRIKAVVQNVGENEVTFVHLNFFRDNAPVKKVSVYQNGIIMHPVDGSDPLLTYVQATR